MSVAPVVVCVDVVGYCWVYLLLVLGVVIVVGSVRICWCCECSSMAGFLFLSVLSFVLGVMATVGL